MTVSDDWSVAASPVTTDLVMAILRDDAEPREPKRYGMTMSSLGGCRRHGAYLDAGVDYSDPNNGSAEATVGRWYHKGLLPVLQQAVPGSRIEEPISWEPWPGAVPVTGHADLAADGLLLDLKTFGDYGWERFLRDDPKRQHRYQVRGYAEGWAQSGHRVDIVQILGLHRAAADQGRSIPAALWRDRHPSPELGDMTDWVRQVRYHADRDPDLAPRDERGPGLSVVCANCPFLTRCWGEDAVAGRVGPQVADTENPPVIASALALYAAARARKQAADDDMAFARSVLEGAEPGVYGAHELGWGRGYTKDARLDEDLAVAMLEFAGMEPPYQDPVRVRGSIRVRQIARTPDDPPPTP